MIKPTIGRVVWFQPGKQADQPLRTQPYAALICFVHSDTLINVGFFSEGGTAGRATSVRLLQEGEDVPLNGYFAEWMPYQATQAKKHTDEVAAGEQPKLSSADISEASIEREIQAKGLTAPRLSPGDLDANIAHAEIVRHVSKSGQVLRWAILTTQNGFAVVGKPSVSVSPENDNAEIGEKVAVDNSRNELWPLMGYALKEELAREESARQQPAPGAASPGYSTLQPHQQRVVDEKATLDANVEKLRAFIDGPVFIGLIEPEQSRLRQQFHAMTAYSLILGERIEAF